MTPQGFTLYDMMVRAARTHGERPALIHQDQEISFRTFLQRVDALAAGLEKLGLEKGERVCLLAQNHPAYMELYGACAKLGLLAYPLNWRLSADEIERILGRARPRVMVVDQASRGLVEGWPEQKRGDVPHWYVLDGEAGGGFQPLERLYTDGSNRPAREVHPDEPFAAIVTAAVDVIPRGAVLTHANLLASNVQTMAVMGLGGEDRLLLALPLFHIAALGNAMAIFHAGGANVVTPRFDPADAVQQIDRHKVTMVSSFPPILAGLLDAAKEAGSTLPSLRIATGIEMPDTVQRLQSETGADFWPGFGQSETTGMVSIQRFSEKPGAAGRPAPLCDIRLVDEFERDVPVGSPGEILVRGPVVFQGYYAQSDVTEHTFRGGWHHTGDVGRFDEEGYLYYVKRKPEKELIKPGGENVYPAEVEAAIMEMPGVTGACVYGVPDPQWGEAIKAVVETAEAGISEQQVADFVAGRIARFKKPKHVAFAQKLPRGDDGMIDREQVKEQFGQ